MLCRPTNDCSLWGTKLLFSNSKYKDTNGEHAHSKLLPSAAGSESGKSIKRDKLVSPQFQVDAVWNVVSLELGHIHLSMGEMYKSELELGDGTVTHSVARDNCLSYFNNALSTFESLERQSSVYSKYVALSNYKLGCTYLLLWRSLKNKPAAVRNAAASSAQLLEERQHALDFYLSAYTYYGKNDAGQTFLLLLVDLFDLYSGNAAGDNPVLDQLDGSFIARALYCLLDCRYVLTSNLVKQYDTQGSAKGVDAPETGKRTKEYDAFVKLINSVSLRLAKILFAVNKILNNTPAVAVEESGIGDSSVASLVMVRELYNILLKKVIQFNSKSLSFIIHPSKLCDILVALLNNTIIMKWLNMYCYQEV